MAFPVVEATNESSTSTAGTSHVVNLPSGIVSGDLLVVILDKGSTAAAINALAGWTEVVDENLGNGIFVAVRDADGTEGSTVTFTSSASTRSAEVSYRISGAATAASRLPELSTVATGTSVNPDATTCTPTGGAKDYLWITFFGMAGEQADDDTIVTTAPTNYGSTLEKTCGVAGTNLGGLIGSAHRTNNAASEDAGAWTAVDNAAWRAYTLAVHPTPHGTARPAAIAVTSSIPAATTQAGSVTTPAATAVTTTIPAATATGGSGGGGFSLVDQAKANGNGTYSTSAIDTTGANLLVVCYSDDGDAPTLSDSKTNTWTQASRYAPFGPAINIRYAWNPTVGTNHTITLTGTGQAGSAQFWAFSGAETSSDPFDQTNSNHAFGSSTVQPGSVTPTTDGQLVIAAVNFDTASGMPTVNSSFSTPSYGDVGSGGTYMGSGSSYLAQSTAAAVNPTFTSPSSTNQYATIVTFKAGAAGGGTASPGAISATVAMPAATTQAGSAPTPSQIALAATLPAPTTQAGAVAIPKIPYRESFNKADGALGPDLTWTHRVFSAGTFQVAANQAVYSASGAGAFEDLQIPTVPTPADDVVVSIEVTDLSFSGSDLWVSAGVLARVALIDSDTSYRGYAAEINKNDQIIPGTMLCSLIIWRVTDGLNGTATNIGSTGTAVANVTLPGTLTFSVKGSQLSASFTHGGPGGTLNASATDATYSDGTVGLGAGHTLGAGDTGSVTVDNFRADLPGAINAPVTVPTATTTAAAVPTPTALALALAVPAVSATGGGSATATPATIDTTVTLPAATTAAGATTGPTTITATVTMPAATTAAGSAATPSTIPVTVTLPQATASGSDAGTATPATITTTIAIPDATPQAGTGVTPAATALAVTMPAAVARVDTTTTPATIPLTVVQLAPTVQAGATATPNAVAVVTVIPSPTLQTGYVVSPDAIALAVTIGAAIAQGLAPDANPVTVTLKDFGHTVTVTVTATATGRTPPATATAREQQ